MLNITIHDSMDPQGTSSQSRTPHVSSILGITSVSTHCSVVEMVLILLKIRVVVVVVVKKNNTNGNIWL